MKNFFNNLFAPIRNFSNEANEYWFGYGSPTTLGVLRIGIGITVFLNLLITFAGYDDWFTERGFVPTALNRRYLGPVGTDFVLFGKHNLWFEIPRFNLIDYVGAWCDKLHVAFPLAQFTFALWVIVLISCVTMTLGLWS